MGLPRGRESGKPRNWKCQWRAGDAKCPHSPAAHRRAGEACPAGRSREGRKSRSTAQCWYPGQASPNGTPGRRCWKTWGQGPVRGTPGSLWRNSASLRISAGFWWVQGTSQKTWRAGRKPASKRTWRRSVWGSRLPPRGKVRCQLWVPYSWRKPAPVLLPWKRCRSARPFRPAGRPCSPIGVAL